jgi:RNA polymerase-binding transcription factor DksA
MVYTYAMNNTTEHKEKLLAEKIKLETELATVGRRNPSQATDWEATEGDINLDPAEQGDVAAAMETFETNSAILNKLELRLQDVTKALESIDAGTYGICTVCGEAISSERLDANPAATTCTAHM